MMEFGWLGGTSCAVELAHHVVEGGCGIVVFVDCGVEESLAAGFEFVSCAERFEETGI